MKDAKLGAMLSMKKILLTCLTLLITSGFSSAASAAQISFKDFKVLNKEGVYFVQTRVDFELSDYAKRALFNGVRLDARIQFRLHKAEKWWFDKNIPLLTIHYQLKYHALSQHYLLTRNDTNENWNYSTLPSALRKLAELRRYQLPAISIPPEEKGYDLYAIADMAPATLRLPLRIQSFFSDKYRLTSKGLSWPLP